MWCIILAVHLGSFQLTLNQKKSIGKYTPLTLQKKKNNNKKYRNEHWSNAGEILRPCSKIVLIDNKLNNFNAT